MAASKEIGARGKAPGPAPGPDQPLLDAAVRDQFGLSWGKARDMIERGKVSVDGRVVMKPTLRVRPGATIEMNLAARNPRTVKLSLPKEAIVFLDTHIVVVEKPSGIATVPYDPGGMGASIGKRTDPHEEITLDQQVRHALKSDIGIVHRIDKETSGLLVFTRSWAAKKVMTQAFRAHTVQRKYVALVHGTPRSQTIESHFVEDRGDGLRGSVEKRRGRKHAVGSEQTQRAVTHLEVVERFGTASLVRVTLETGRTHQIRIHLAEAGHPLLGERVYIRDYEGEPIASPRVMLHAAELGFDHPVSAEPMHWESKPPQDMEEMLGYVRAGKG